MAVRYPEDWGAVSDVAAATDARCVPAGSEEWATVE